MRMDRLRAALGEPLPGMAAKRRFWRRPVPALPGDGDEYLPAAVLILFYERDGRLAFPLMERTQVQGDVHSGQISLPGGRVEAGESYVEAALREAEEELHIRASQLQVLGELSPHWIPVSSHLVHPVVAWAEVEPDYRLETREVAALVRCSVEELREPDRQGEFLLRWGREEFRVPCWHLDHGVLWGATAMILAELLAVLDRL